MEWKDVAGIVGKAAPMVGTLIGGPAGAAIGAMVSAAIGADNTPDAVAAAVAADPQAALKLAEFESDNRVKLQGMTFAHAEAMAADETKRIESDAGDRKSARDSAVAGGTASKLFWLSVGLLLISLGAEITLLFRGLPPNADQFIAGRILGMLDSIALGVMAFNYGTTSNSMRKTELLAQAPPVR